MTKAIDAAIHAAYVARAAYATHDATHDAAYATHDATHDAARVATDGERKEE